MTLKPGQGKAGSANHEHLQPIASMQRLEAAGFKRAQAEILADELRDAMSDLVTNEQLTKALDAQADKLTLRICGILGGLLTIGFAAIGLAIAFS